MPAELSKAAAKKLKAKENKAKANPELPLQKTKKNLIINVLDVKQSGSSKEMKN